MRSCPCSTRFFVGTGHNPTWNWTASIPALERWSWVVLLRQSDAVRDSPPWLEESEVSGWWRAISENIMYQQFCVAERGFVQRCRLWRIAYFSFNLPGIHSCRLPDIYIQGDDKRNQATLFLRTILIAIGFGQVILFITYFDSRV